MAGATKTLTLELTGRNNGLGKMFSDSESKVRSFQKTVDQSNKSLSLSSMAVAGAAAGVTALAAGLTYAITKAVAFDKAMRNVNSLTGLNQKQFAAMEKQVISMSTKLPQSATTLAEGLYDIASSGFQGADGIKVLDAAARSASAGLTSTATSSKAITAVLNAYGLQAKDAADVSDVLFSTVNLGVITFDELANNLGDVVGATSAAKVGIDEVGAAIATMTLSGIKGAQATTALSSLTTKLVQPSTALAELYDKLGYKSGAAALEGKGLHGVLEDIRVATGGNITTMLELFPDIEAARGALALMANDGANYNKVADQITDKTKRMGATQRVLDEQMKSVSSQWQLFTNKVDAAAITVGVKLLPGLLAGMQAAQDFGAAVGKMAMEIKSGAGSGLDDLGQSAENVIDFLKMLGETALSIAEPLGKVAGGAVLATFNALAGLLEKITGLALDNQGAVMALGLAYAVHAVGGVQALTGGMGIVSDLMRGKFTPGMYEAAEGVLGLGDKAKAAGAQLMAMAPALAIGATLAVAVVAWQGYSKAADRAGEVTKGTQKVMSSFKVDDLQAELQKAQGFIADYQARVDDWKSNSDLPDLGKLLNVGKNFETLGMGDKLKEVQEAADATSQRMGLLQYNTLEVMKVLGTPIPDEGKWINDVQGANGVVAQNVALGQMNGLLEKLGPKLKAAGVDMGAAWNDQQMVNAYGALRSVSDGTDKAAAAQKNLVQAMGGASDALTDTKDAADALKTALDGLMGASLGIDQAQINWMNTLNETKKTLKDNGATLSFNTAKGRENRQAVIDQVVSLQELLVAGANAGESQASLTTRLMGGRAALIAAGTAAKIPKQAMIDLLAQYKLTPELVQTLIKESGAKPTADKLKDLAAQADALGKKKPKPTVTAKTAGAQAALDKVNHMLDALDGKNASTTVTNTTVNRMITERIVRGQTSDQGGHAILENGGIINSYADGKLPDQAMVMQPKGDYGLVQWAEKATGGEAFIPLAQGKRGRSEKILGQVADKFGLTLARKMADGGVTSYANGGISETFSALQATAEKREQAYAEHRANRSKSKTDTAEDWYRKPVLSLKMYTDALKNTETYQRQWSTTTRNLANRVGIDVVNSLEAMGEDGEAAIRRMATSSAKDMQKMAAQIRSINFKSFFTDVTEDVKGRTAFQANLAALTKMGRGDLAGRFAGMGYEQAAGLAATAVKSPGSTLTQLNNQLFQQENLNDPKLQDAYKLMQLVSRSGGKLGVMGLAQSAGMPVGDVLGLLTKYESQVFGNIPAAAMKQVRADQALLRSGKQPSGLAMGAIVRGSDTGYYWGEPSSGGESLIPHGLDRRKRAMELWQQTGRILGAGSAGGGGSVVIQTGAIQMTINAPQAGATAGQIKTVAQQVMTDSMGQLTRLLTSGRR